MSSNIENSKRIAKNTLLLYLRMLLTMAVSLYTSRVILQALGAEDFGIYNVVGGVVSMFSLLSGTLSAAISRFITFELGTGDFKRLKKIFSASITIQLGISIIIIILVETIGVWFLNSHMNIPQNRIESANWVLQLSLITFTINLISVPYNASIIAHEKMSAFAYISIIEALGKLAVSFLIMISPIDKLILYSILMCFIAICIRIIYGQYCKRNFKECSYQFIWDKTLLKRMFSFAGWNFIGSASFLLKDQGVNIVINIFCGPTVNAARGIAMQVNNAVTNFIYNFQTAINPQITKSYAEGNKDYMYKLIYKGTRFSYYLLLCLSIPFLIHTEYILRIWLHEFPDYTVEFVRLILILSLSDILYRPLLTAHLASGRIKELQIIVGGLNLLILPISYLALYLGYAPTITVLICIAFSLLGLFLRIYLYSRIENFKISKFTKEVLLNILIVSLICIFSIYILNLFISTNNTPTNFILTSILYTTIAISICYNVGLNRQEKKHIINYIKTKITKHHK